MSSSDHNNPFNSSHSYNDSHYGSRAPYQLDRTPAPDPRGPAYLSSRREADGTSEWELDIHNRTWNSTLRPRLPEFDSPLSLRSTRERHHVLQPVAPCQYRPFFEQPDESASQLGTQDVYNARNLEAQLSPHSLENNPAPRVIPTPSHSNRAGSSLSVHSYHGQTIHSHPVAGSQQVLLNSSRTESSASHGRNYETYLNPSLPQARHIVHGSVFPMTQNSITSNRPPESEARASWHRARDSNSNYPLQTSPHLSTVQGRSREIRRTSEEGPDAPRVEDAQADDLAPVNYPSTRKRKSTAPHERSQRQNCHQIPTPTSLTDAQADLMTYREDSASRVMQRDISHTHSLVPAQVTSSNGTRSTSIPDSPQPYTDGNSRIALPQPVNERLQHPSGSSKRPGSGQTQEDREVGRPIKEGFFAGAQQFTVRDSTMVGTYVQTNASSQDALQWLGEYTMKGADLDSSERSPPPRCHPGTRRTIMHSAQDWFNNPPQGKRLLWLRGQAGVGKSAIVQTLAEGWSEEERLGASIFFSRERRHTNPSQVFPSLAYRMATQDTEYAAYIAELKRRDPLSLGKAMSEQFRLLFIEPFARRKIRSGSKAWVITLDGLDECGEDEQTRRHSDDIQRDIVDLINRFAAQNLSVPLVWIIASRPEAHLKAVFAQGNVQDNVFEVEVPVDSPEACQDVEKYLDAEFKRIRERYPNHISESLWPTRSQFEKISQASSGLFAFAAVIIRFIDDPVVRNPIEQLKWVMQAITKLLRSRNHLKNPLAALDALYTVILSRIPTDSYEVVRQILGASMYLDQHKIPRDGWNLTMICNAYGIEKATAITALSYLHSVIKFRPEARFGNPRPGCYHTSFRDFLQDHVRSCEYFIEPAVVGGDVIQCGVTWIIDVHSQVDVYSALKSSPWPTSRPAHKTVISEVQRSIYESEWKLSSTGIFVTLYSSEYQVSDEILELFLDNVDGKFVEYVNPDKLQIIVQNKLQKRGIIRTTTIDVLSLELEQALGVDWRTKIRLWSYPSSDAHDQALDVPFSRCLKHTSPIPVTIFGKKKGQQYGQIQAKDFQQFWRLGDPRIFKSDACWLYNI